MRQVRRAFRATASWVLICVIVIACRNGNETSAPEIEDPAKAKVRAFWQLYGEATQLRVKRDYEAAAERYREALENNPAHEDSLYYVASCLAELGRYGEAVDYYRRLIRQDPASHRGHFQLGITLSTPLPGAPLDLPRAREYFTRNLEINREESGPFLRLGDLALYEGRLEEARRQYDIAAGFQSPEGLVKAGAVRYLTGEYRAALPLFVKVLEINAHEKKISGRGIHSEGDVRSQEGLRTPLEQAGLQALVFLHWAAARSGGYPADVEAEARIKAHHASRAPFRFVPGSATGRALEMIPSVRDLWSRDWLSAGPNASARVLHTDLDGSGTPVRIEAGDAPSALRVVSGDISISLPGAGKRTVVDVVAEDFDGDGVREILALEWKHGLQLFRNKGGGRFEVAGTGSGLPADITESYAVTALDYDRDGRLDVLLAPYPPYAEVLAGLAHPTEAAAAWSLRLFRNTGSGRFEEIHGFPGLSRAHGVMQAVSADFDRDGFPDLFLACGGLDPGRLEPSVVLRNEQGKSFSFAAYVPGFESPMRALAARVMDADGDGRLDIVVRTADGPRLFRNIRDGGNSR